MMKYLDDSTIVASLIIGVAIVLSTFIYSMFNARDGQDHRYTLLKGEVRRYEAIKIDHKTGEVWGIRSGQQRKIEARGN